MSLYIGHGIVNDENEFTNSQLNQLDTYDENLSRKIEQEIKSNYARFHGKLADGRTVNQDTIPDLLIDLADHNELDQAHDLCHDLVHYPVLQRLSMHRGSSLIKFIQLNYQIPQSRWNTIMGLLNKSFDQQNLTLSDYPFLKHVYDLENVDDYEEFASQYYQDFQDQFN